VLRACSFCQKAVVQVPRYEMRQFCRNQAVCRKAGSLMTARLLPSTGIFLRAERVYRDSETGGMLVGTEVQRFPSEAAAVPDDDELGTDLAGDEPLPCSAIEPLDRLVKDDTDYLVERVTNVDFETARYRVRWARALHQGAGALTWEPVTHLFGSPERVVAFWKHKQGQAAAKRFQTGSGRERFKYDLWADQVCKKGSVNPHLLIAYVLAVQLTQVSHPTPGSLLRQLQKGSFKDEAEFTVWVVPSTLTANGQGCVAVPLTRCRYTLLQQLVEGAEWAAVEPRLVNHVKRSMSGSGVGAFWWHSSGTQDSEWNFSRIETPAVPFVDILHLPAL
jgi:hypothetical protein